MNLMHLINLTWIASVNLVLIEEHKFYKLKEKLERISLLLLREC